MRKFQQTPRSKEGDGEEQKKQTASFYSVGRGEGGKEKAVPRSGRGAKPPAPAIVGTAD